MTTTATTPTADYRAGTDPTLKNWHLTSVERGNACFCGAVLIWPTDTRKVALKVAEDKRDFELSEDLTKVSCGACKRSREYGYATGTATRPVPEPATEQPTRRRGGRRAAGTLPAEPHASGMAAAAAEANADTNGRPSKARKTRQSRADRANAAQQRDAAKRAATAAVEAIDAALADNAVAAIEGAVAEATGEAPVTGNTAE